MCQSADVMLKCQYNIPWFSFRKSMFLVSFFHCLKILKSSILSFSFLFITYFKKCHRNIIQPWPCKCVSSISWELCDYKRNLQCKTRKQKASTSFSFVVLNAENTKYMTEVKCSYHTLRVFCNNKWKIKTHLLFANSWDDRVSGKHSYFSISLTILWWCCSFQNFTYFQFLSSKSF